MSYAVRSMTASAAPAPGSSGEAHPRTATVLDYNCLFTHDLKRKQKRWQDGRLKYHTFNKKIMVYDDRGNFIGDAHWQAGGDLEENEELDLDRGAAIIQVADFVGSREQDLTEVLDKRAREVEKRRAVAAAKTPASSRLRAGPAAAAAAAAETSHFQLNHRPLSSIVPSPGPIGRASIPGRSPYEARKADTLGAPREQAPPPARKRRRSPSPPSKAGFARSLFGAALSLSSSAGGSANRKTWPLKERGVNDQDVTSVEISDDDDVVVVEERPRMKTSLNQSRRLEGTAYKRPHKLSRTEFVSGEGNQLSESCQGICGQPASRLGRDMDSLPVQPGSPSVIVGGKSRKAQSMEDEHVELRNRKESDIVHGFTDIARSQRRTESRPSKRATHFLQEEEQPTLIPDEESGKNKTHESSRRIAMAHQWKHGSMTQHSAASELQDLTPSKPQERRTELRIRSRKRRGLLMVAEKRQQQQTQQSLSCAEPTEQSINADSTAAGQKLFPHRSVTTNLDECTIKATPKLTSKFEFASEAESVAPSPSDHSVEARHVSSGCVPGISVARDERSESPEGMVDGVADQSRRDRISSPEDTLTGVVMESQKALNSTELDDGTSHGRTPTASPRPERAEATLPTEEQTEMSKLVIENEASQPGKDGPSELVGKVEAQKRPRRASSEVPPANMSTDEESEDFPPARTSRSRRRVELSWPPSSEEIPACHAPTRRRSARMKKGSRVNTAVDPLSEDSDCNSREGRFSAQTNGHFGADTAKSSSSQEEDEEEEEADCASRKRPKRRQSRKTNCSKVTAVHQPPGPAGPHIKRLARKSVKSKEIFGFIPSLGVDGSATSFPFAMTASRVGVVGRPPSAPNRPPGICLTIKPGLLRHDDGGTGRLGGADEVEGQAVSSEKRGCEDVAAERVPHESDGANGLLVSKDSVPNDVPVPRAKIANPATRGKKAARKTDAAGQAPQHVVPFEPPQPVRPVPRAKPSEPLRPPGSNARGVSLPGFSTAKGGAWSTHAEDLLGMTRPTGKRT
ncbi:hypothetical protein E4U21_001568 [Claviceps maximensis]|nr:hypothetical protein E4U21_001568 [Claviceps maximensis]